MQGRRGPGRTRRARRDHSAWPRDDGGHEHSSANFTLSEEENSSHDAAEELSIPLFVLLTVSNLSNPLSMFCVVCAQAWPRSVPIIPWFSPLPSDYALDMQYVPGRMRASQTQTQTSRLARDRRADGRRRRGRADFVHCAEGRTNERTRADVTLMKVSRKWPWVVASFLSSVFPSFSLSCPPPRCKCVDNCRGRQTEMLLTSPRVGLRRSSGACGRNDCRTPQRRHPLPQNPLTRARTCAGWKREEERGEALTMK